MPARVDIPLPLACGPPALEYWNPPPGCAAAREPPPLECAAALLPPPDFCLSAKAICGAINISETQIQMNALMNCTSEGCQFIRNAMRWHAQNAWSDPDFSRKLYF